ncbi:MAG TPA: hypothetical protein VMV36_01620 [Ignavibacteriaceae bacterium]|nr:hypothetical protein [Ignavibacteriaceae bacterium]
MFGKNNIRNTAAVILIAFVSGLYFFKYSAIYLKYPVLLTGLYLIIFSVVLFFLNRLNDKRFVFLNQKFVIVFSSLLVFISFLWITFIPRFGEVGRLPAIEDWIKRFFNGSFPYNSPFTPSGFPVLFFLSVPFYLLKNIGYLEVIGLSLFLISVIYFSNTLKENLFRIIILLLSPVLYYGFVVRDELFFNMMIPVVLIFLMEKFYDRDNYNYKFDLFGILFGLALSTRSVVAIIYAVYIVYLFKSNIPKGITFIFLLALVFWFTLLPFFLWDQNSFLTNGPFAVQSYLSFLPFWNVIIILGIAIYLGWIVSNLNEVFFATGIMLFLPVFLSMLYKIFEVGFYQAVVYDVFDLSYFIFCMPFLLLSIQEQKTVKSIGKILA